MCRFLRFSNAWLCCDSVDGYSDEYEHQEEKKLEQMLNLFSNKLCGLIASESYAQCIDDEDEDRKNPLNCRTNRRIFVGFVSFPCNYIVSYIFKMKTEKKDCHTGPKVNRHFTLSRSLFCITLLLTAHFVFVCHGLSQSFGRYSSIWYMCSSSFSYHLSRESVETDEI